MITKRIFFVPILAILIVLFACSSASIHAQQRGSGHQTPFERDDKNGDGRLSRDEFRGPAHAFKKMDMDGDGFITQQEAREARQGGQKSSGPQQQRPQQKKQDLNVSASKGPVSAGSVVYLDTHNHLVGQRSSRFGEPDYDEAVEAALGAMNKLGVKKMLIMPQPFPDDHPQMYDYRVLDRIVSKNPTRFGFLGGGGTLNPMIQKVIKAGNVTSAVRREFEKKAAAIVQAGALGFGEMTAEHISMNPNHPYVTAPPNHPLFLLLADIAARNNVPIDIHMEAIPKKMPLPHMFRRNSTNPDELQANIPGFERLLAHNRKAKIIWVHAGWDNTRQRTAALSRDLLEKHPNLYMSIRVVLNERLVNRPIDSQDKINEEWLNMINAFPDRFIIGSDQFYPELHGKHKAMRSDESTIAFLSLLPPDLARKVGYENARRIFNLNE